MDREMGRLTPEKIASIRKTYEQERSFKKTGEIEGVDPRVVKRHVASKKDQLGINSSDSVAVHSPLAPIQTPSKPYGEIEAEAFSLYGEGKKPLEAVIILKIPAHLANKMYMDYLISVGMPEVVEIFKNRKDRIPFLVEWDKRIEAENLDINEGIANLGAIIKIGSSKEQLQLLEKEIDARRLGRDEYEKQEKEAKENLDKTNSALEEAKPKLQEVQERYELGKQLVARLGNEELPQAIKGRIRDSLNDLTMLRVLIRDAINVIVKDPDAKLLLLKTDELSVHKLVPEDQEKLKEVVALLVERMYNNLFTKVLFDIFFQENENAKHTLRKNSSSADNNLRSPQRYYKKIDKATMH